MQRRAWVWVARRGQRGEWWWWRGGWVLRQLWWGRG